MGETTDDDDRRIQLPLDRLEINELVIRDVDAFFASWSASVPEDPR